MFRKAIFYAIILMSVPAVSSANGPSGGSDREKQLLHESVIGGKTNLYGDEIPIAANDRTLRRASKDLAELGDESLFGYEAAFYIFPKDGKPITLAGALLPAGESIQDIPNAIMHIRADAKTMVRLNELPHSTIVYGVDATGNKAWYPLELFSAHSVYPGFISADGFYAYTYRPTPKLYGRYGETAYYLDILRPGMLEEARLGLDDNITLLGARIPENIARVGWFVKSAFFAPLVPRFHDLDMLRNIHFEITLFADRGLIDVRLPYGVEYDRSAGGIRVYAFDTLFEGLSEYREAIALQLETENNYEEADAVRDMDLSVTHFNATGDVSMVKKNAENERFSITMKTAEGEYTYETASGEVIDPDSDFAAHLGRYLATGGRAKRERDDVPHNEFVDWRSMYDANLAGIARVPRPAKEKKDADEIAAYKPYELDLQPSFRGGNFESFVNWLYSEVQVPSAGEDNFLDSVVLEFIVDEEGKIIYVKEVESTWYGLISSVYAAMSTALDEWSPGEIAGLPVKTRYRFLFAK